MHENPSGAPVLVITPSTHAARSQCGVVLDEKALSGLEQFARHWPGTVRCVLREGPAKRLLFAKEWQFDTLPCEMQLIPEGAAVAEALVADAAVVMASGDNYLDLPLAPLCRRLGVPLVYVIENTIGTRLKIEALEKGPLPRRLKSAAWQLITEARRRLAFRDASGLAANGVGATRAYGAGARDVITFFDNRMTRQLMATPQELSDKLAHVLRGEPLRLGFSGRLEPLKGADHLVPVARGLAAAGLPFSLEIFGTGSLEARMREEIRALRLGQRITMHAAVDFQSALVPHFRRAIDLFVCCHRQSDPSCTYMEAMGCAVPIAGYGNAALRGLLAHSAAGVATPMDRPEKLAAAIVSLSSHRDSLAAMMRGAFALASGHDFESTFARRVAQCVRVARPSSVMAPAPGASGTAPGGSR